jgi:hypothetical protein
LSPVCLILGSVSSLRRARRVFWREPMQNNFGFLPRHILERRQRTAGVKDACELAR